MRSPMTMREVDRSRRQRWPVGLAGVPSPAADEGPGGGGPVRQADAPWGDIESELCSSAREAGISMAFLGDD